MHSMTLLRTFIAIEIPGDLQASMASQIAGMKNSLGRAVRWVPAQNVHLTLKFLGDVSSTSLESLQQTLIAEAGRHRAFELQIGSLGCFPNPRRPRVIWVGISAPPELDSLQRAIDSATAKLGYAGDERPFSPHLTVGRVSQHATPAELQSVRSAVEAASVGPIGSVQVSSVDLFRSDLQPSGPIYTRLVTARLIE